MARLEARLPDNVPGDLYVDRTCIDCGTCRHVAPAVFAEGSDHSYVYAQPGDDGTLLRARMAMVACPTSSIGSVSRADLRAAVAAFPEEVLPGVDYCGFASPDSYGASAWLVRRPEGNVLVDSPRAAGPLLRRVEALGGVRFMFLTHRDDVADHTIWARHFGAERILHVADRTAATADVERIIAGDAPVALAPDLTIVPLPGHTRGSMGLLYRDDILFSGDHLWAAAPGSPALAAGRHVCWYDWPTQIRSMERLLGYRFGHVLPGHGAPWHGGAETKDVVLAALIARMRSAA
ncbi:MAG: MBL fold metallo-hydrolase [Pseudomonadota bacterium]|nr:MBL fold metallo-hydrolase [Pseudomonadota bacterium]